MSKIIFEGISRELSESYLVTGIFSRNYNQAAAMTGHSDRIVCKSFEQFLERKADIVIEAAGVEAAMQFIKPVLNNGSDLILLSTGALADAGFYQDIQSLAQAKGRKVYLASGAIGGFDIMQAMAFSGSPKAAIATSKPPFAFTLSEDAKGHSAAADIKTIFKGNALSAIQAFPQNINVALSLALATAGVTETDVTIHCHPGLTSNVHEVTVDGGCASFTLKVAAKPSVDNPKSSALAAYSVLAKLKNLASGISFC